MKTPFLNLVSGLILVACWSCTKPATTDTTTNSKLSYSDAVFYLKNSAYTVAPSITQPGKYTSFPDNLQIDNATGVITVSSKGKDGQSQTGLRYKITFQSANGDFLDSTFVVVSGISYYDGFHYLSQNDSIISPIYNCDASKFLPTGNYDIAHDNKFAINPANGQININECIRRGYFDDLSHPTWKQTTIKYSINDNSGGTENNIDVILYYYNKINDVPSNVSALMQAHRVMSVGVNQSSISSTTGAVDNNLSSNLSLSKPRPPCVVIIGH